MSLQAKESTAAAFAPRRLGHANLFVGDLDRSMDFYSNVAGFEAIRRVGDRAGFHTNGNTHHDLGLVKVTKEDLLGNDGKPIPSQGRATQPGLNHFGWELENELAAAEGYRRAEASGVAIRSVIDHYISRGIYLFDPDGHLHEFYGDRFKDWRSVFKGHVEKGFSTTWDIDAEPPLTEANYPVDPEIRRVPDALIHPEKFTHAVLSTASHEAMIDFYRDVAGLTTVYRSSDGTVVCLAGSHAGYAFDVALVAQEPGQAADVHHYSYRLAGTSDLEEAVAALAKAEIPIERRIDTAAKRSLFINDPDGLRCEFYVAGTPDFSAIDGAATVDRPFLL